MKKTLYTFLLFILASASYAQKRYADYDKYVQTYAPLAVEQMKLHGIPASITLAQGLLESAAGKSALVVNGNNHFGIKCHDWTGRKQYADDDEKDDCFRVYSNARQSFEDHSLFLKKKRYERLFTYKPTDYKSWAYGLKECGYATSPTYAQNLIRIIETYELYRYDNAKIVVRSTSNGSYSGSGTSFGSDAGIIDEHDIVRYVNGKPYILARKGDTFESISSRVDISVSRLAKYNERERTARLSENDIIFLKKKATKGEKMYQGMYYVVKSGESMYSISQKFGIRLKNLYKMNGLSPDASIKAGQKIVVRL